MTHWGENVIAARPDAFGPMSLLRNAAAGKPISLALQGGGLHGAFIWGVLDRLLQEDGIEIEAVSATGAGALNATCLAYGIATGGAAEARRVLRSFWQHVDDAVARLPLWPRWRSRIVGEGAAASPQGMHILRAALDAVIDFEELQKPTSPIRLFLSATNVRTGRAKVFRQAELCTEAVLAAACQPTLFDAVEYDGEHYWDSSALGGSSIVPLVFGTDCDDVVVVHAGTPPRSELPRTLAGVMQRVNEIGLATALRREIRALHFATDLASNGERRRSGAGRARLHAITADFESAAIHPAFPLHPDADVSATLCAAGRRCAGTWLDAHFAAIGLESSIELYPQHLCPASENADG